MSKKRVTGEQSSTDQRVAQDRRRRAAHRVPDLQDGFTLVPDGRDGIVYYRENGRVLALPYEMDGTQAGILLYVDGLESWVFPDSEPTSPADRERIRSALEAWSRQHRGTVTFSSRRDLV